MGPVIRIEIPIPFPIRSVNAYFIPDSNPTLIDAGFRSEKGLDAVELAIKKAGYRLTDIKRILLTHGHLDHIGLAGKIAAMSGTEVLPGHGARFSNAGERAREITGHHRMRRQEVLDAFSDNKSDLSDQGGMTLFMVSQAVFPKLRGWDIFLGLSEAYGHLEVLEEEGLVTSRMMGDQRLYCLSPASQRRTLNSNSGIDIT